MTIEQSSEDLEGLLHQLSSAQSYLQSCFGLAPLLLCVLQPDYPAEASSPHLSAPPPGPLPIALLSPDWQTMMGWNVQALRQQNWFDLVHPEDVAKIQALFQALLQSPSQQPQSSCQFEIRMRSIDGGNAGQFSLQGDCVFSWRFILREDGRLYGSATQVQPAPFPALEAEPGQSQSGRAEPGQFQPSLDALHPMLERERLLIRISQRIRQTLNLDEILKITVAEVRDFLQSDRVVIFQFSPDWNGQAVVESVHPGCASILHQIIFDPCFEHLWHQPYLQGRIHHVEDVLQADLKPCYRDMLTQLNVRANLVVPILQSELQSDAKDTNAKDTNAKDTNAKDAEHSGQQNRLWGLLIAHQCNAPRQWKQEDVSLLTQFAAQVAVAIQQSELHQQLSQLNATLELQVQQRTAQLEQAFEFEATLKRITDKVRDSLDESHILETVVRELTLALNISSCDTGIYNHQQQTSTIAHEYIQGDVPSALGVMIPMRVFPEYYQPLLQGEYLQFCWHNTVYISGQPVRAIKNQFTVLACPIIDNQSILGDLCLYKQSDAIYEEQEIRLVQQVANQCAIAIRQARLYHASQTEVTELERLNYLKDDFLNTISHELRTPVSNIKMAAELLELHLEQMQLLGEGTVLDRPFEILKHETQREINLINDLLDLSHLDANIEPLLLTPIDPGSWLRHVAEPFIERAHIQQQTLELHIPDALPALTTDLTDLERIVTELLDNACKYTPAEETIALTMSHISKDNTLQISVSNTGVEIPPQEQARIFDKFYRIPNNDPWKYDGVGLGLALVKKLAQRLGATIQVESANRHITFRLTVPIALQD
jgi:signal transduction histidine kinase